MNLLLFGTLSLAAVAAPDGDAGPGARSTEAAGTEAPANAPAVTVTTDIPTVVAIGGSTCVGASIVHEGFGLSSSALR